MGHSDIARIPSDLPTFRPTFVLAVPAGLRAGLRHRASARRTPAARARIFDLATATAIAYSQALEQRRTRPRCCGRAGRCSTGSSTARSGRPSAGSCAGRSPAAPPLGARLGHFFRGVGVTVLEGYGLTETTAATTVNTRAGTRIGTVGRPLPGFEVRIADDGVMHRPRRPRVPRLLAQPVATAAVLDADGWFHTGDLGSFDADGYLTITGRAKEILVTSSGKNVSPAPLEDVLRGHAAGQPGHRGR